MKRWLLVCMAVAVVLGISVAVVWADDTFPPPWQRGGDRTTYQDWTFGTPANPVAPDVGLLNPYGNPTATIFDAQWAQYGPGNHVGVWSLLTSASYIDVPIANALDHPDWNKDVWTQLTWWSGQTGITPSVFVDGHESQLIETVPTHDGWMQSTWYYVLPYNPPVETVHVTGLVNVGELVVDTICIPEPSSLALLAMGALGLAAFVWRRRRS
jgi:hypothetical protein